MVTSRPAHVLGDVVKEIETEHGDKFYRVLLPGSIVGAAHRLLDIPAQYVLVGDELEDLYDEEEENEA